MENFSDLPEGRMNSRDYLGDRWKRKNYLGYPEDHMVWGLMQGYQEDHFLVGYQEGHFLVSHLEDHFLVGQKVLYLKQNDFYFNCFPLQVAVI